MEFNALTILWDVIKELWWLWALMGIYAAISLFQEWRRRDRKNQDMP